MLLPFCNRLLTVTAAVAATFATALADDLDVTKRIQLGNDWAGADLTTRVKAHGAPAEQSWVDGIFQADLSLLDHEVDDVATIRVKLRSPGTSTMYVELMGERVFEDSFTGTGSLNTPNISLSVFGSPGVSTVFPLGPFDIKLRAKAGVAGDLAFDHMITDTPRVRLTGGPRGWAYGEGSVTVGVWVVGLGIAADVNFATTAMSGRAEASRYGVDTTAKVTFDPYHLRLRMFVEYCGWLECVDLHEVDLVDVQGPTRTYSLD